MKDFLFNLCRTWLRNEELEFDSQQRRVFFPLALFETSHGPTRSHGQEVPEAFPPRMNRPERASMPDHHYLAARLGLHSQCTPL